MDGAMEIGGRYKLIRQVAQGGAGVIYCAADSVLGRTVAVKALRPPLDVSILRREAHALAQLDHPNVVTLYDIVEEGDRAYLILEFVDGCSLEQWLQDFGPLAPDTALSVFGAVAAAVHAAHSVGLLHCDIKPANVLISKDGEIKLTDFTLAQIRRGGTYDGTSGATEAVAAPEQVLGEAVDVRTDVYGLGQLLSRMVEPLDEGSEISRKLQQVITRAIATARDDRFASAEEMTRALPLENADATKLFGRSIASQMTRVAARRLDAARQTSRSRWAYALVPLATILLALGLILHLTANAAPLRFPVPSMVSLRGSEAARVARSLSFHVQLSQTYSSSVPPGIVIEQSPPTGSQLVKGGAVHLTVSEGPRPVVVPDVQDLTEGAAAHLLQRLGFRIERRTEETIFGTTGIVRGQSVPPGTTRTPGTTIAITVSVHPWWWPLS